MNVQLLELSKQKFLETWSEQTDTVRPKTEKVLLAILFSYSEFA